MRSRANSNYKWRTIECFDSTIQFFQKRARNCNQKIAVAMRLKPSIEEVCRQGDILSDHQHWHDLRAAYEVVAIALNKRDACCSWSRENVVCCQRRRQCLYKEQWCDACDEPTVANRPLNFWADNCVLAATIYTKGDNDEFIFFTVLAFRNSFRPIRNLNAPLSRLLKSDT